jgi:hypothetical protein
MWQRQQQQEAAVALSCRVVSVAVIWRDYCLPFDQYSHTRATTATRAVTA